MIQFFLKYLLYLLIGCVSAPFAMGQNIENNGGVRVAWEYRSLRQIAEKGGYPRMLKIEDDNLLAVYENYDGDVELKRSEDQGATWSAPEKVFSQFSYTNSKGKTTKVKVSNPEIIQLPNQDLILAVNYRPVKDEIASFSIVIKRSTDNGNSWSNPAIVYTCGSRFEDGCWEPSFVWTPDKELQLYFANETPYQESDEQEIAMISSTNYGRTWSNRPQKVSFRENRRDGMPVGVIKDNEIIIAIEDNKVGEFKPYLIRTNLADKWKELVSANSSKREYALKERQADSVYMGAPYLIDLPYVGSLLSYQTNKGRRSNWEYSTMEVVVGDDRVRNFGSPTRPFPIALNQEAKWNSLVVLDTFLVAAMSSTNIHSERVAPWMIKGHIIPNRIKMKKSADTPYIFVGATSDNNLNLQVRTVNHNFKLVCRLSLQKGGNQAHPDIVLFFKLRNKKYKIIDNPNKEMQFFEKTDSGWASRSKSILQRDVKNIKNGSTLSYELLNTEDSKTLLIGGGLVYMKNKRQITEYLVHMHPKDEDTWIQFVR